jgi:enoyl-CoA hydratase/carnithine racemase
VTLDRKSPHILDSDQSKDEHAIAPAAPRTAPDPARFTLDSSHESKLVLSSMEDGASRRSHSRIPAAEQPDYRSIRYDCDGGIATITLSRPESLNAYDEDIMAELRDAIRRSNFDNEVRVLIVTGAGRAFCSGRDIGSLDFEHSLASREYRAYLRENSQMLDDIEALEKPVIASINGPCVGGGVEIAIACDFRIAADTSFFQLPELRLGLIPASGAASRLIQMIGMGRVKELVMTGDRIDANEAHRIGLVTRVVPDNQLADSVRQFAERLSTQAPLALGMAKQVINICQAVDPATGRVIERLAQSLLVTSDDAAEGVDAFRGKRDAKFEGR